MLTVIATDGEAVQPVTVETIISFSGKSSLAPAASYENTYCQAPPREGKRETDAF